MDTALNPTAEDYEQTTVPLLSVLTPSSWCARIIGFGLAVMPRGVEPIIRTLTRDAENPFGVCVRDDAFGYTIQRSTQRGVIGSEFGAGAPAATADFAWVVSPGMGPSHNGFPRIFADLGYPGSLLQAITILILLAAAVGLRRRVRDRPAPPLLRFAAFWSICAIPNGGIRATSGFALIRATFVYRLAHAPSRGNRNNILIWSPS